MSVMSLTILADWRLGPCRGEVGDGGFAVPVAPSVAVLMRLWSHQFAVLLAPPMSTPGRCPRSQADPGRRAAAKGTGPPRGWGQCVDLGTNLKT